MNFIFALLHRNLIASSTSAKLTLSRTVIQPTIYLLVFGHIIGRMMPGSIGYSEVMAPGMIAIAAVSAPLVTISGYILSGYFFRTMEAWLLAPVSLRTILIAMVVSGTFSGIANSLVVVLIAWLVLGLVPASVFTLLLVVAAGSLLFSLFTLTVLLLPVRPDKGQEVFSFLMMPMTFFGCTFYSFDMLEPPYRYFALLFPTTYISEGLRAAYAPTAPHMELSAVLTGLVVAAFLLFPLADFAFRRRLGHFTW